MAPLVALLLALAPPARADLAGACAYAGASSDCLNKIRWTGQRPEPGYQEPREPRCDAECRRREAEWEERVLASIPPDIDTRPLEPDPQEETVWHYAHAGERDQETEVVLANANILVLGAGVSTQPELWPAAAAFVLLWALVNREALVGAALSAMDDLTRQRARDRNDTRECENAVAQSDAFCDGNSCDRRLGGDPCMEARIRLTKGRFCKAAREAVRDLCHGGVDDATHAQEVENAQTSIDKCILKIQENCRCDDPEGLSASASASCAALGDCMRASSCAETVAAAATLRLCRYTLENLGTICPEHRSPSTLSEIGGRETDCRALVLSRCGRDP